MSFISETCKHAHIIIVQCVHNIYKIHKFINFTTNNNYAIKLVEFMIKFLNAHPKFHFN